MAFVSSMNVTHNLIKENTLVLKICGSIFLLQRLSINVHTKIHDNYEWMILAQRGKILYCAIKTCDMRQCDWVMHYR